jgi:hypothetical protein
MQEGTDAPAWSRSGVAEIMYNVLARSNIYAYYFEKYLAVNSVSTQRASRPMPAHHRIASCAHLARRAERKIGIILWNSQENPCVIPKKLTE